MLLAVYLLYLSLFSPLAHIPGPLFAKVNPLWLAFQCRFLRRAQATHAVHEKYGPVVRVGPAAVSVASTGCLSRVYGPRNGAVKGPFYDVFESSAPIIFSARDSQFHAGRRKDLTPAFTKGAMRAFEPHMNVQILELKRALLGRIESSGGAAFLDFKPWAAYLAFDVIADFVFGHPFGFLRAGYDFHNLISTIDDRMRCTNALGALPSWARPLLRHIPIDSFWKMNQVASVNLRNLAEEALKVRRQQQEQVGEDAVRKDMLTHLINAKQDDGGPIPEASIVAEAASFISGGSDSTSTTLSHFVDLVTNHPSVKRQLQMELDDAFPGVTKDWVPSEYDASVLQYLNACLRETMRLRPASASGLERLVLRESMAVNTGISSVDEDRVVLLPVGTLVSVPTYTIHRREDIFPQPELFRPERWLRSLDAEHKFNLDAMLSSWAPFSFGTRGCLGKSFAWMELNKTLASKYYTAC